MTRMTAWLVGALILAASGVAARTQDRLFIGAWDTGVEVGAFGHLGQVLGPSRGLHLPLAGGGRYAVLGLTVVDLRTGAMQSLPASSPGAGVIAVDPARPVVFLGRPSVVTAALSEIVAVEVTTGASRVLWTTASCQGFGVTPPRARHAGAANTLYVQTCPPAGERPDIVAIDMRSAVSTPRVVASVPVDSTFEVSSTGDRVFAAVPGVFSTIEAYDTTTGTVVATSSGLVSTMAWDETREWLIVGGMASAFDGAIEAFDRQLRRMGTVPFPGIGPCGVRWQVSPHTGRIYVATGGSDYYGAPPVSLTVFDGQPLARVGTVEVTPSTRTCGMALRTAPGAPRGLHADVSGHSVTLRWEAVGAASHVVLDVGFAPGRPTLSFMLGPDVPVTFDHVPAGTYYVQLRGGNEFGGGRPSEERRIVVPALP